MSWRLTEERARARHRIVAAARCLDQHPDGGPRDMMARRPETLPHSGCGRAPEQREAYST